MSEPEPEKKTKKSKKRKSKHYATNVELEALISAYRMSTEAERSEADRLPELLLMIIDGKAKTFKIPDYTEEDMEEIIGRSYIELFRIVSDPKRLPEKDWFWYLTGVVNNTIKTYLYKDKHKHTNGKKRILNLANEYLDTNSALYNSNGNEETDDWY